MKAIRTATRTAFFSGLTVLMGDWASGNEALDLLEGKITEDEVTVTSLLKERESETLEKEQEKILHDSRDYSSRWKNRLAPVGIVYENDNNAVVQRAAIDGLVEWGLVEGEVDPDNGVEQDVSESRLKRLRLGGLVRALYNTDLEGRAVFDGDGYQGIDTLKATVQVNDNLKVEAGKFRPPFSQEYRQDPSVRATPELSPIVAQIAPANTLGVRVETGSGPWEFGLGWFSGARNRNIPGFDGGGFILANLSYTFDGRVVIEAGEENTEVPPGHQKWHLDYLYNTSSDLDGAVPDGQRHLFSTGIELSSGNFDFAGDFLLANGGEDTAWGLSLTGRYWVLEDALRLVGRYNYAGTAEPGGLSVGFGIPGAEGDSTQPLLGFDTVLPADEFHSFYLGFDLHVLQDYLVFSSGLEFKLLRDEVNGDASDLFWRTGGRAAF